jgi:hypothetical protein
MSNLACITCHYNFNNFQLPIKNLHSFLGRMEDHRIPVYGIELILPYQKSETKNLPNWKQIEIDPESNIMWQKEALLNLAEKLVPRYYENIAWIDADIIFFNRNWIDDTIQKLQKYDILHLYEKVYRLDVYGKSIDESDSIVKNIKSGCSGHAWAMKRYLWKNIDGLYDRCIAGGGDLSMAKAFLGFPSSQRDFNVGSNLELFKQWSARLTGSKIGHLSGVICHEYHGSRENRQHMSRSTLTRGMDLCNDVEKDHQGIFQWNKFVRYPVKYHMKKYFLNRKEDL